MSSFRVDALAEQAKDLFKHFLEGFVSRRGSSTSEQHLPDYMEQMTLMKQNDLTTLYVDFGHLQSFDRPLGKIVLDSFYRVEPYLCAAVSTLMKEQHPDHASTKQGDRAFFVSIFNTPYLEGIRNLKCGRVGSLMTIQGTVTRTSQVRPELLVGAFQCLDCGAEVRNVKQQFKYTEPSACVGPDCANRDNWSLVTSSSTFVDWQMVRVQENAQDIPAGSMPRSIKVILRNEIVENAKPGDKCVFTGTLIVVPDVSALSSTSVKGMKRTRGRGNNDYQGLTGLKALGVRDLTYKLCFLASNVRTKHTAVGSMNAREDSEETDLKDDFTQEERERILGMKATPRLYSRIVNSIAPTIFGHEEIKRGVLLMLMGGVHKKTPDGGKLRGDINVCIVGDPSTSKSQFLKYVCSFLPRTVYTSGKASSAAGLTASVVRDQETGEFTIEAGALMLADNGICCIDEFDKMDPKDQVAIHEAMEQQTISIAKAGIKATLNARTSILAAANPVHGRYDHSKTLKQNIDISAPIMSRFDLFFIVLDMCDEIVDYNIARHIVNIHKDREGLGLAVQPDFSTDDLQTYIRFARTIKPKITKEARDLLVKYYTHLREGDAVGNAKASYRMTVRQLESMVRLAEARARLDLEEMVLPAHVKEAYRLLKNSVVKVDGNDVNLEDGTNDDDDDDDDEGGEGGEGGGGDGDGDEDGDTEDKPSKKELVLDYNEYTRISNMLVIHMRAQEDLKERAGEVTGEKRQDLVDWYVSQAEEHEKMGLEATKDCQRLIRCIIGRLVDTDHVFLLKNASEEDKEKQLLLVHPNYNPEDDPSSQTLDDEETQDLTDLSDDDDEKSSVMDSSSIADASSAVVAAPSSLAAPSSDPAAPPSSSPHRVPKRKQPATSTTTTTPRRSKRTPKK